MKLPVLKSPQVTPKLAEVRTVILAKKKVPTLYISAFQWGVNNLGIIQPAKIYSRTIGNGSPTAIVIHSFKRIKI
jgi:hypothetical protein